MKFSLKTLAAAVVMATAAAGASAATIDNGAGGNGGLFFSIWDSNGSYTRNLGLSIDSFQSGLAAAGSFSQVFAADSALTSFLGTANLASLQWNVMATDSAGARRMLATYTDPKPATPLTNDLVRTLASSVGTQASNVNVKLSPTVDSAIFSTSDTGYAGKSAFGTNLGGKLNFSDAGTLANNSAANSLSFLRIDAAATGIAKSAYTQYQDGTDTVKVYLDGANALHFATAVVAVPEPESYAMLLAGLGMLGFMARRRLNNRA